MDIYFNVMVYLYYTVYNYIISLSVPVKLLKCRRYAMDKPIFFQHKTKYIFLITLGFSVRKYPHLPRYRPLH